MAKILVVYHSGTGNTEAMAEAVAEGVKGVAGIEIFLRKAKEASVNDLLVADAIAFGSPTHFLDMADVLKALFDQAQLLRNELAGKLFVAFTSGGGSEAKSLQSIENMGVSCGLQIACPGIAVRGMPTESQKASCRNLGATLSRLIKK